jgi:NADH-quinone oxidoreductase subunit L
MVILLILILLFPLLGFLTLGIGFHSIPKRIASIIGPGTVLLSFLLSLFTFLSSLLTPITTSPPHHLFTWLHAGPLTIPFDLLADPLSILMLLIITGVGFIIHVYSVGYMKDDPGFNRFFSYMNLFIFSMLLLVLGASYPVMFIGWEGVGLCSYLLIGFWFKNREYGNAAKKAFIMNRIGDLGFLLGMFLIFSTFGSLNYSDVFAAARVMPPDSGTLVAITLLLFVGAIGKSAQIPLYTWLPDAMAGPTPVSALIHAATMVTAGIYMIARSNILYVLAPTTLAVVSGVGLATALFAASIAMFQNDIKKVLAYSTISQLGYMFIALGAGAFTGAMFHLTTHAFFKALLFLAAGSVIHAMGGEQDIRKMGGLKKTLPKTYLAFLVGTLAIAGIPPLSGFFSKDEILSHIFALNPVLWALAVAGSLMTAFYMFRLLWLTFSNKFRGTVEQRHHLHESPAVMTVPLNILAILAAAGGVINLTDVFGGSAWLQQYLAPVFADSTAISDQVYALPSHSQEWLIMGITLALVLAVMAIAYNWFVKNQKGIMPGEDKLPLFERVLARKYYVDELYEWAIEKPVLCLSGAFHRVLEIRFIDRIVNGIGDAAVRTGNLVRYVQTGNVGFYMFIMIIGMMLILIFNILI